MPNEEALGPRKTMFVLVIVVGCFAVLWPRILSPLVFGGSREPPIPNKFDREAGCCEVIFESEIAVLKVLEEVCDTATHVGGKLSPGAAADCRKAVNETCGVDIAAFLKRNENVGKTTKMLLDTMKASNSSCLKEHFGVPELSLSIHPALNSWTLKKDTLKQERSPMRAGPHPALRERGRAIPPGGPPPARPAPLPPHARPPPIPGMRPPLGGAGGAVPPPKSSMGFVMPIYTACIVVFFVYTLSKVLFRRAGTTSYETVMPDPQFRRRVFRDDSRSSPDRLVVSAISGLVAEVQQQMEASYAQNQQRQEQANNARPYTNGTIIHSGPVQIVASEYREPSKEKSPEPQKEKEGVPEPKEPVPEPKVPSPESEEASPEPKEPSSEPKESSPAPEEPSPEPNLPSPEPKQPSPEPKEPSPEPKESSPAPEERSLEPNEPSPIPKEASPELKELTPESEELTPEKSPEKDPTDELIKLTEKVEEKTDTLAKLTGDFLNVEKNRVLVTPDKQSTPELLEEALKEDSPVKEEEDADEEEEEEEEDEAEKEKSSVKVVGMEVTTHSMDGRACRPPPTAPPRSPLPPPPPRHEAEEVKSIFLETEIPQQSRVLVADFADRADSAPRTKHTPMVVSGKMTLSLIQDEPRDTPDRDLESTVDDFTTASGVTQPAAEKDDNLSDEEVDEEIEVEEIDEMEIEEDEEDEEEEPEKTEKNKK